MSKLAISGSTPIRSEPWPQWPQHGTEVHAAIQRVAESNNYHPQFGTETEEFEKAFAEKMGARHAVAVSHGTLALQAAMDAADVGCGDEIICPAYTYVASAAAAIEQNAIPVLVDSEPLSQGLDPEDVKRKITPHTKAIVAVHANGYPCDMDSIMAIAEANNLAVIEDCSHAHGTKHAGRRVGTIGTLGAFSLQNKKNLSAGTGGITITDNDEMAQRMRDARTYTWNAVGHNWQISEFSSAIAAAQLPMLDEMNQRRRQNVKTLLDALGRVDGITPLPGLKNTEKVYYNLILEFDEEKVGVSRDLFCRALNAEGIPVKMFYVPLQNWPIFPKADFYGRGCPFSCPKYAGEVDYGNTQTPVADKICYKSNIELKVQPTNGPVEMRQTAEAILKILENIDELKQLES